MPFRMFSEVLGPNLGSRASRPSSAAASSSGSESMPSTSWIWRILATPRPGDGEHLDQPRRDLLPQILEQARASRGHDLADDLQRGRTDTLRRGEAAVIETVAQVRRKAAHRPRRRAKGADAERVFALELEERRDLLQHLSDRLLVHEAADRVGHRAVAESSFASDAGAPAELEQLLGADDGIETRGLSAGEHRREERCAVRPLQPIRPRPGGLHRAEAVPIGPQPEDAEHPEIVPRGVDEAAIHRLRRPVVDDPSPHLAVEELGVVRPGGSCGSGEGAAGPSSIPASRSEESDRISPPASHSR